jgi:glycosyltransferase involved in cell wall biosynthesis
VSVDILHAVTSSLSLVVLRGQLRYLKASGFQPAVLSAPGAFVDETRRQESVPVFEIPMERDVSALKDLRSLGRIWQLLRRVRPALCNAGTPKAGFVVTVAAWLARVPCRVYTMRGLRLETARGPKRYLLYAAERITCTCAHRVICVSPSLRDRAVAMKLVSASRALVLASGSSNGIDARRFVPTPARVKRAAEIRRELTLGSGPVIGYIGRFTRDKGVADLIAAFDQIRRQLTGVSLLLIGNDEPGDTMDAEVRARIDAGLGIRAIPFQSDIAPYYLVMELFVLPTHREGFPNTVLEAQAAERPVVTTMATGAIDSVVDGKTGTLVPVGDSEALAEAIVTLLTHPAKARSMGLAARERVEREFRQEIVWTELVKLYRQLLEERGLPAPVGVRPENGLCLEKR